MTRDRLKFGPLRVGIGGPVGAGKTSMTEALCKILASDVSMAVITNDIYTEKMLIILFALRHYLLIEFAALKLVDAPIPLFVRMHLLI